MKRRRHARSPSSASSSVLARTLNPRQRDERCTDPQRPFVREVGAGPTVVCLHSSASSSAQWRPLMERLAGRHRARRASGAAARRRGGGPPRATRLGTPSRRAGSPAGRGRRRRHRAAPGCSEVNSRHRAARRARPTVYLSGTPKIIVGVASPGLDHAPTTTSSVMETNMPGFTPSRYLGFTFRGRSDLSTVTVSVLTHTVS